MLRSTLALFLAFGVGLSLGLLGSGGSIVTLPVLVHVAAALPGMAVGARRGDRLPAPVLRRVFGWFVLAVAGFVFAKNRGAPGGRSVSPQP